MYTEHELYIGVRAFEPHGTPHAALADRDKVNADDFVSVYLDTFHDRRRALVFTVNALGVQADGLYSENDVLFSYQPNPGTVVFAGYGSSLRNPFEAYGIGGLDRVSDGFFVKVSYLFRL